MKVPETRVSETDKPNSIEYLPFYASDTKLGNCKILIGYKTTLENVNTPIFFYNSMTFITPYPMTHDLSNYKQRTNLALLILQ